MPETKKKRTCVICGTEHSVGEACPTCEWNQEEEETRAKGDIARRKIREELEKSEKKPGKKFWS